MPDQSDDKKIIIDEDWKSQVEREKEELTTAETAGNADSNAEHGESQPTVAEPQLADDVGPEPQLPPASLAFLVSTLAAQAMSAMGQLPDPLSGKPEIRLKFAQHHIDMLDVLQQKTQGNASAEESAMIEDALHQLRMMFVQIESQVA